MSTYPEHLSETIGTLSGLSREDRDAVARVLGLLRQTDMTGSRVRLAVEIVQAVRLAGEPQPTVWRVDSVPEDEASDGVGARYRDREGHWETQAVSGRWVPSAFGTRLAMTQAGYVLSLVSGDAAEVSG